MNRIKCNNNLMKNFRSSKNLKPVDPQTKQQGQLRIKIKLLEEQIAMLQKSNLNIFIPLSEHAASQSVDYQSIINRLRQQILIFQQQNQAQKATIKKTEKQKQQIKTKLMKKIEQLNEKIVGLEKQKQQIQQELENVKQSLEQKIRLCQTQQRKIIEQSVELKFLNSDLSNEKSKRQNLQKEIKQLKHKISQVLYGSRIYKSLQMKVVCIQKKQYDQLKEKILELQAKIRAMIQAARREKITLGSKKQDIGQQIVRLKKNIDLQLGIQGNSKHSQQFLKIYKGTNDLFNDLIKKCKA